VAETADNSQLTLLTTISDFDDSTLPFLVSKNKTFAEKTSADFEMHEGHDYTIRTSPKTFLTEILFVDWLKTVFLPWIETRVSECITKTKLHFLSTGMPPKSLPESWRPPVLKELSSSNSLLISRI
jgi:hypothetical protein